MQYLLLIYSNEAEDPRADTKEYEEMMSGYFAFTEKVKKAGVMNGGNALASIETATTVRVRDGKMQITDGPFAETKEMLGGYYLLNCENLDEAIGLGQVLLILLPDEPEVAGLLALMLLHDSRRAARVDDNGNFISLEYQDRSLWDQERIRQCHQLLRCALSKSEVGAYLIQAAISSVHAYAESFASRDWRQICYLYDRLYQMQPSLVIKLNGIGFNK